jgi:hypothetical protein
MVKKIIGIVFLSRILFSSVSVIRSRKIRKYFSKYIKSIEMKNYQRFLSFQNSNNKYFFTEQKRWFKEVGRKEAQGYIFVPNIDEVKIFSKNKGEMVFRLKIIRRSGREKNYKIVYKILKNMENKWQLDDYNFHTYEFKHGILLYSEGANPEIVKNSIMITPVIIDEYIEKFEWSPTNLSIKIFSSLDEISASIPSFTAYGWSEKNESIKILVPAYEKNPKVALKNMLRHEISHNMISDLTNDNASLYLQEGIAVYLEKNTEPNRLEEYINEVLKLEEFTLLSIKDMNSKSYKDGRVIYHQGFLLTNFLIKMYGNQKFKELLNVLKSYQYIDERIEYKKSENDQLTFKSLELVYGNYKRIHKDQCEFYGVK